MFCVCVIGLNFFFIHAITQAAIISNYIASVFESKETRMVISRYFDWIFCSSNSSY